MKELQSLSAIIHEGFNNIGAEGEEVDRLKDIDCVAGKKEAPFELHNSEQRGLTSQPYQMPSSPTRFANVSMPKI